MKTKNALLILAVLIAASFSACKKDAQVDPNSPSDLGLKIQALNKTVSLPVSASGFKSTDTTTAKVVWDTATMIVSKVSFEAEMESSVTRRDSIEIEYTWRGPQTINLFDLSTILGSITLPAGVYEKISLKINSDKMDANGKPLFYLSGMYTNAGGTTTPIVLAITDPISFKTALKDDTIAAGGSTDFTSTIQIYLDQLLLNVDLTALDNAELTNGALVISATSNRQLYMLIMQNLRKDHQCMHEHHHRH